MIKFINSLHDRKSNSFSKTLKSELENLPGGSLPLDQGTSQGGYVDDSNITATVLRVANNESTIQTHVGIFFTEIVVGCGCGDDPMPINAYCEMLIEIDKITGQADFNVVQE